MKLKISEASQFIGIQNQSLRIAVASGRLKCTREGRRYLFEAKDLIQYRDNRWGRSHNFDEDELSPHQAADFIGCKVQHVYHLLRTNRLSFWCKGKKTITISKREALNRKIIEDRIKVKKMNKKRKEKLRRL